MSCCEEHKPCGNNLGCLNQIDSKCVFLNNCEIAESLNIACGENMEVVIQSLIDTITSGISAVLGEACPQIYGGDPFDINTWLENLEAYVCTINPLSNVELIDETLTFTFNDGSTINIDLGPLFLSSKVQNTIFVDSLYGNDTTGQPEDRNKPYATIAGAIGALTSNQDVIHVINSNIPYTLNIDDIASSPYLFHSFHLDQFTAINAAFNSVGPLDLDGKNIEIIGRGKNSTSVVFLTTNSGQVHNYHLKIKSVNEVRADKFFLRNDCNSTWENISIIRGEFLIFSDTFDEFFGASGGEHKFRNIDRIDLSKYLASLSAINTKSFQISFKDVNYDGPKLINYQNSVGDGYKSTFIFEDSNINCRDDVFNLESGTRNPNAFDWFKNCIIESRLGAAYRIGTNHAGEITMTNVRLEAEKPPQIDQLIVGNVDAKLQDTWSNLFPTNPMTSSSPTIEFLHIDGEDNIVNVNTPGVYNMGSETNIVVDATLGNIEIRLQKSDRISKEITVIATGDGVNTITLAAYPGDLINGVATKVIPSIANTVVKLKSSWDTNNIYGWATISI